MRSVRIAPGLRIQVNWLLFLVAALALLSGLPGCDSPATSSSYSADTGVDVKIVLGATISITGPTAQEGAYARDGYEFAVDAVNRAGGVRIGDKSYRLVLKYYDDQSNARLVPDLYRKLLNEDHANILLGPYSSALTMEAVPVAEEAHIPLIDAHGSAESIFANGDHYTFGILSPAQNYLRGIIALVHATDPSAHTVALIGADEAFSHEVLQGASDYAQEVGMQVVYSAFYPINAPDLASQLLAVKAMHPDLLLGSGHLQDSLLLARQVHDLGLTPKAIGLTSGPSTPEFRTNLQGLADYIFGATQWTSALKYKGDDPWGSPRAYADAFRASHPTYDDVPYQTAESSAAVIVAQRALEKAGATDPESVRAALTKIDFMTFYGRIKFDERGVNIYKPMVVEQLQPDGHKYTVFPRDVAEKDALYPMPASR